MKTQPRTLVILRIGSDHRVSPWAKTPAAARDWDLLLSPYDTIPDLDEFDPEYTHPVKGGKWDAIFHIFDAQPELLESYDYFWLPDDDIETTPDCPVRLVEIAHKNALQLCQPALKADSQFSHLITIRNRFTRLRFTNFVELMAPLMTAGVLRKTLPHMRGRWAAHGLDYFWHRFAASGASHTVAIIDAVQVGHYRPKGKHLEERRRCPRKGEIGPLPSLFEKEASRNYCPVSIASPRIGFRSGLTLLSLMNLAASPVLWKRCNFGKILSHFGGQLFLSDWQGTRN